MGTGGGVYSPEVKRPVRETDHSPPFSAEVKNSCSYTTIHPICFLWCGALLSKGATLPLPLTVQKQLVFEEAFLFNRNTKLNQSVKEWRTTRVRAMSDWTLTYFIARALVQ